MHFNMYIDTIILMLGMKKNIVLFIIQKVHSYLVNFNSL